MKFSTKVMLIIASVCFISTSAAVIIASGNIYTQGQAQLLEKSRAILTRLEAVREYVALQGGLNLSVADAVSRYPNGDMPKEAKEVVMKQVPIFASMRVAAMGAEAEGYSFRVFSTAPRNKDNQATLQEIEILKRFEQDPKLTEYSERVQGETVLYRPIRLAESQGCLTCHGDPASSPWKNGRDILGYEMENWKDQKLHGVFAVKSSPQDILEVKAAAARMTWNIVGWSSVLCLLTMGIAYWILSRPMKSLSRIATDLRATGVGVAQASVEISKSSDSLSQTAATAAASIEETTAATEEMSSMIRLNAENAGSAKSLTENTHEKAREGRTEVERLIQSMDEISRSSKKIEEIIAVIDDIAFQTNLLALNASVEAARAGEHGKGFAVVAEAVRGLAQKSSASAREISLLIQESATKVEQGHKVVLSSGGLLNDIAGHVEKLTTLSAEISNASTEQAQGANSISLAVNEFDRVTQSNAAAAAECASAASSLMARSRHMEEMVNELISVIGESKKVS
ncbi:MAG: methyl-accepting chemotaxis protein [Bdellovibrio sp.]